MSNLIDTLRDIACSGWPACDEAADEIESLEKAYELLFAENAKLREAIAASPPAPAVQAEGAVAVVESFEWPPTSIKVRWLGESVPIGTKLYAAPPPVVQQAPVPVGIVRHVAVSFTDGLQPQAFLTPEGERLPDGSALYAAPQPAAQSAVSDEQIAAAVRPLYADDVAAGMGLADDIRTARAVLALATQAERPAVKEEP